MNAAHLHLAINHLPVVGSLFALILVVMAMLRKNAALTKLSLEAIVFVALLTLPVYLTGEPAEEQVEHLSGTATSIIEAHESSANLATTAAAVLGVFALGNLIGFRKREIPRWVLVICLALSLLSTGLMAYTANLGGQIRHPEIRSGTVPQPANNTGHED